MAKCLAYEQVVQNDTLFPHDRFLAFPQFRSKPYKNNKLGKY